MALIFPRIARNFIKNGYFPTDEPTLRRIASALDTAGPCARVLDPCCGEGAALLHLAEHLQAGGAQVESFAVEVDEDRAWHAKAVLGTVAHADIHDVRISERSMGLLFLNPPYGDLVTDQVRTGDTKTGRERHEKLFCRRSFGLLQTGGVLVLVIPFYTLDAELSALIARHFEQVQVFISHEQAFKQCVVFGVKRRVGTAPAAVVNLLMAFGRGDNQVELPEVWAAAPYMIPEPVIDDDFHFTVLRLDARQLGAELDRGPGRPGLGQQGLWPRFEMLLGSRGLQVRPPLRPMKDWHLALALAAGQISGVVCSESGQRLLIKGRTHKGKSTEIVRETAADGTVTETRIMTDKFVTVIRGIDVTAGPGLGQIVTIS